MPKHLESQHPESQHPESQHPEIHAVDEYLDGELEPRTRAAFEAHLEICADCREELALARRISSELQALPQPACPPAVTRTVLEAARPTLGERLREAWRDLMKPGHAWPGHAWQPALALLLVAALGLGLWLLAEAPPEPAMPPAATTAAAESPIVEYSPAEIARAKAEVELAFAYLGKIGQTASDAVEEKVLENRMMTPFTHTLGGMLSPGREEKGEGNASS